MHRVVLAVILFDILLSYFFFNKKKHKQKPPELQRTIQNHTRTHPEVLGLFWVVPEWVWVVLGWFYALPRT